ncbi:MAG: phosphoribosylformylglycinamidine cyclo-ligase [Bdellovibrionales bacterium]|nr:phosphoribosylformylglycinamidine cyclo-ligase [Bdellovibrionales bacterium]
MAAFEEKMGYAQSGVDRSKADRLVETIAGLTKKIKDSRVKASVGGYASLYALDSKRWIAASTDGVGTKLKLAFQTGIHNTVGIDLVAMSVNDILCVGAEPLFFLDYFATGRLDEGVAAKVIEGIVEGCRQSGSALVGGETAEMPDFYQAGEYDLGGFAVGFVEPKKVIPQKKGRMSVKAGDIILGLRSSGCHSNGYSLLRKLLDRVSDSAEKARLTKELLVPTRIYRKALSPLLAKGQIKGLAHITGSGYLNVPRISEDVGYEIELPKPADLPSIYEWVTKASALPFEELTQTFNLGIGMVVVCDPKKAATIRKALSKAGETVFDLGQVVAKKKGQKSFVKISQQRVDGKAEAVLYY